MYKTWEYASHSRGSFNATGYTLTKRTFYAQLSPNMIHTSVKWVTIDFLSLEMTAVRWRSLFLCGSSQEEIQMFPPGIINWYFSMNMNVTQVQRIWGNNSFKNPLLLCSSTKTPSWLCQSAIANVFLGQNQSVLTLPTPGQRTRRSHAACRWGRFPADWQLFSRKTQRLFIPPCMQLNIYQKRNQCGPLFFCRNLLCVNCSLWALASCRVHWHEWGYSFNRTYSTFFNEITRRDVFFQLNKDQNSWKLLKRNPTLV